jgi:hypothetical protein
MFNWREHLKVHPAADLFPLMSEVELQELADDIKENGLKNPIVLAHSRILNESGERTDFYTHTLVDGRNRLDALALLGWLEPAERPKKAFHYGNPTTLWRAPIRLIRDDDDGEIGVTIDDEDLFKFEEGEIGDDFLCSIVASLNVHRRHLTAEKKRDIIDTLLKRQPEQSNRTLAKTVQVDHKTVAARRSELESTGDIPQLEKTVGADGKARKKPIHWQQRVHPDVAYEADRRGVTARAIIEQKHPSDVSFDYDPKDDPESSPADTAEVMWQRALRFRAGESAAMAAFNPKQYGDWTKFKVTDELIALADQAAKAWADLANKLKAGGNA